MKKHCLKNVDFYVLPIINCSQLKTIQCKKSGIISASCRQIESNLHFILWLLEETEWSQHLWCCEWRWETDAGSIQRPVDCTSVGSTALNGPVTNVCPHHPARLVLVLPVATMLICLLLLCPFGSTVDWSKTQVILRVSKKKKKSFLFWLLGVYRVWWVGFFSSLVIAASGLHKDCGVCSHFNKYSIKMLRCVDFLVSW